MVKITIPVNEIPQGGQTYSLGSFEGKERVDVQVSWTGLTVLTGVITFASKHDVSQEWVLNSDLSATMTPAAGSKEFIQSQWCSVLAGVNIVTSGGGTIIITANSR